MDNKVYNKLSSIIDFQLERFNYNYARYKNDPTVDLRTAWEYDYGWNQGFDYRQDSDLFRSAYTNVIKSAIDSIVSKLANQKARPYFTPVNGTYRTRQVVKQVQQFFDAIYEQENVHEKISKAFFEGCIFGTGYIWVNPITFKIEVLPSWCVATLATEKTYAKETKLLVKYSNYPASALGIKDKEYVTYEVFVDTEAKNVTERVDGQVKSTHKYNGESLPIVSLSFNEPIYGNHTPSIVEELDSIQTQIDLINSKISACAQLTPANTTYVLEGSNLQPGDINNRVGNVYGVKCPPGMSTIPVVNVTPSLFDPSWQQLLEYYIKQAYEIVGISQLSAMSKKPAGLDSGTALQTMEDIESDRFETQITKYVSSYVKLARVLIDVLPEDADIVLPGYENSSFKWKDVKKEQSAYKIQNSAATALSKDPQEKLKQILQLSQVGLIGPEKVGQYLDTPDLNDAYEGAEAVSNGIDKLIETCIETGDTDIPDYIGYQQLAQRITIVENQLYSSLTGDAKNDKDVLQGLNNIVALENNLMSIMTSEGFIQTQQPEEAMVSEGGIGVAPSAINAADISQTLEQPALEEGQAESNVNGVQNVGL